jgi:hypothetical protein
VDHGQVLLPCNLNQFASSQSLESYFSWVLCIISCTD